MILSYATHKPMKIEKFGLKIIGTDSPIVFKDLIKGFKGQNELLTCSDDQYNSLLVSEAFDFIGDVELTNNIFEHYMPIIVKKYIANLDENNRNKIIVAYHNLESLLQDSLFLEDLPLEIEFNEDLKKFLKITNLHLDEKILQEPYDIIESVLKIHQMCGIDSISVFCNVANYLDTQQINELSSIVAQMNQKIFLIEFTEKDFMVVPKNAEFYYIDRDLVDWY